MPRQYTTRRERKRLWCAFFLLLALAAFLLWQELSPTVLKACAESYFKPIQA